MNLKNTAILSVLLCGLSMLMIKCKHELPASCSELGFKISYIKKDALLNKADGSITVTATGGSKFQYSLNGGAFQDSGYFSGLSAFGNYKVFGRNSSGCLDSADVNVGSIDPCKGITITVSATKVDAGAGLANGGYSTCNRRYRVHFQPQRSCFSNNQCFLKISSRCIYYCSKKCNRLFRYYQNNGKHHQPMRRANRCSY